MAWDVTVCTVVDTNQHFGENCCPQFCKGLSYMSVPIHEIHHYIQQNHNNNFCAMSNNSH